METIFYNCDIITMENNLTAEAVYVSDGRIAYVGTLDEVCRLVGEDAQKVDLCKKTLMPAFIDAHSHFSAAANSLLQVALDETSDFEEIGDRIVSFIADSGVKKGDWIVAKGYDHNALKEKRHPKRDFLDKIAPDNPLLIQHKSGHAGVFNSAALSDIGVTSDNGEFSNGEIEFLDGAPTGYMEETAFIKYVKMTPMPGAEALFEAFVRVQEKYASHGIATVQEGMMIERMGELYDSLLQGGALKLDVVAYIAMDSLGLMKKFKSSVGEYDKHFKIGGLKIFLDGSPQARTAWMLKPYAGGDATYCGYGTMSDEDLMEALEYAASHKIQILAHCNGDAAAKQFISTVDRVSKTYPEITSQRPVIIHAQLIGTDMLSDVKRLGIMLSFFVAHVYHWGDIHIENFTRQRASQISPANSALQHGVAITFHQDTPVIEPDMLETVWCAVNRMTKGNELLGADERISVIEALKAVTINAAFQYFEEDEKGSLRAGKRADLVILDKNPLKVPPEEIRDIKVIATVKDGEFIYRWQE
ncbi:MAG: amidohydrolase [Oscillospiraceae bacterium]